LANFCTFEQCCKQGDAVIVSPGCLGSTSTKHRAIADKVDSSGLLVTRGMGMTDAIAFPGITADFDVVKVAAVTAASVDTNRHVAAHPCEMVSAATAAGSLMGAC
jgi:hypothetical protein